MAATTAGADDGSVGAGMKRRRRPVPIADDGEDESSSSTVHYPIRNTDDLYAASETISCAMDSGCVPCAYKIGCFDVALDKELCKVCPNQRPEQCPRSPSLPREGGKPDSIMGFRRGMSVLLIGDGDFSFSLAVARILKEPKVDGTPPKGGTRNQRRSSTVVATSYEKEATLRCVYPDFDETMSEMKSLGVKVAYEVDATAIERTLPPPLLDSIVGDGGGFHRICWNFPCTAIARGQDGQNKEMEDNKELVRKFVQSAKPLLSTNGDGEIVMCHKTKPPFNQWHLEQVVMDAQKEVQQTESSRDGTLDVDAINESAATGAPVAKPLVSYAGRVVLDRFLLPPYTPRKALDRKSFPCHDACFYVFAQEGKGDCDDHAFLFPPTIPAGETRSTTDGGASSTRTKQPTSIEKQHDSNSQSIVKIDPSLISTLRQSCILSSLMKAGESGPQSFPKRSRKRK